jgi:cyclopropane fatty-acyl-phospholipid synthase-like methyltransferase
MLNKNSYDSFEAYGRAAEVVEDLFVATGRYAFQADSRNFIVEDVLAKMRPARTDHLFEIGCGVGLLLIPLAQHFAMAMGMDHESCIVRMKKSGIPANVELIAGRWPETHVSKDFDCILVYSVLHYLSGRRSADEFIDRCLEILKPGGKLLLGDIPNMDSLRRYQTSRFGIEYGKKWNIMKSKSITQHRQFEDVFAKVRKIAPYLTDDYIMKLISRLRRMGYEAYVMAQKQELPFSHSREDVLIWKRR